MTIDRGFSGGFGMAVSPESTHTLMKVEVRAENWKTAAFTHFRPGSRLSKTYLQVKEREQTLTDYIIAGARVGKSATADWDCLLAVMNIAMEEPQVGMPTLEVFSTDGLVASIKLGEFPPLACRHMLLSDLLPNYSKPDSVLILRLIGFHARMVMSAIHLDLKQKRLALDHGSDKFSTYLDYGCG